MVELAPLESSLEAFISKLRIQMRIMLHTWKRKLQIPNPGKKNLKIRFQKTEWIHSKEKIILILEYQLSETSNAASLQY